MGARIRARGLGTYFGPELLPYWTHGCIAALHGLYLESSTTTPFAFLSQAELSPRPEHALHGLDYPAFDVARGVEHLRLLGVRYYLALSVTARAQAAADPALRLVASSGPWPVSYSTGLQQRTWQVYEVSGSEEVAPLLFEPVVLRGASTDSWREAAQTWFGDRSDIDVPLAAGGPATWERVHSPTDLPRTPVAAPATISNIRTGDDRISFDVDRVGAPVVVKATYFRLS